MEDTAGMEFFSQPSISPSMPSTSAVPDEVDAVGAVNVAEPVYVVELNELNIKDILMQVYIISHIIVC